MKKRTPVHTVTSVEARARFGELLDRVERGEEVVITRHDKPVARIVREGRPPLSQIQAAVREMRAIQAEMAKRPGFKPITDREIREAIAEGRK